MEVWGYRRHPGKLVLCLAGVLCTGGLLGLIFYWLRHWWVYCTHSLTHLELATSVLIVVRQWIKTPHQALKEPTECPKKSPLPLLDYSRLLPRFSH